jgi:hypothetical protein
MPRALFVNIKDVNKLQYEIMVFVGDWARREKTPVPRKEIISAMEERGTKFFTTINALNSLMRKGYIRRSCEISNKTRFVQLKGV